MKRSESRRWFRRKLDYPAFVLLGDEQCQCLVSDIAVGGARLEIDCAATLPDEFILCLSVLGPPCRKCRVIWRNNTVLGIEWVDRVSKGQCSDNRCHFNCTRPSPEALVLDPQARP